MCIFAFVCIRPVGVRSLSLVGQVEKLLPDMLLELAPLRAQVLPFQLLGKLVDFGRRSLRTLDFGHRIRRLGGNPAGNFSKQSEIRGDGSDFPVNFNDNPFHSHHLVKLRKCKIFNWK